MRQSPRGTQDLGLVGGGYDDVDVLRSGGMRPVPGARIRLVAREVEMPCSEMLPGRVAGLDRAERSPDALRWLGCRAALIGRIESGTGTVLRVRLEAGAAALVRGPVAV